MVSLSRAQRVALKRIYDRQPIYPRQPQNPAQSARALTYRQFRRTVRAGYNCVMVEWAGMWLGIEPDGYTHS